MCVHQSFWWHKFDFIKHSYSYGIANLFSKFLSVYHKKYMSRWLVLLVSRSIFWKKYWGMVTEDVRAVTNIKSTESCEMVRVHSGQRLHICKIYWPTLPGYFISLHRLKGICVHIAVLVLSLVHFLTELVLFSMGPLLFEHPWCMTTNINLL